jgi:hypothetical protein
MTKLFKISNIIQATTDLKLILPLMKQLSRAKEHRCVHIMTTGVHHAINSALMLPLHQFLASQVRSQQNVIIPANDSHMIQHPIQGSTIRM